MDTAVQPTRAAEIRTRTPTIPSHLSTPAAVFTFLLLVKNRQAEEGDAAWKEING